MIAPEPKTQNLFIYPFCYCVFLETIELICNCTEIVTTYLWTEWRPQRGARISGGRPIGDRHSAPYSRLSSSNACGVPLKEMTGEPSEPIE